MQDRVQQRFRQKIGGGMQPARNFRRAADHLQVAQQQAGVMRLPAAKAPLDGHIHIIPRFNGKPLNWISGSYASQEELKEMQARLLYSEAIK